MSLRAYLRKVLTEHVALPSMQDWLERVRGLGRVDSESGSGAELVSAAREEDDELVGR